MMVDDRATVTLAFVRNSVGQIVSKSTLGWSGRDSTICSVMFRQLVRCNIPACRTFYKTTASTVEAAWETLDILSGVAKRMMGASLV